MSNYIIDHKKYTTIPKYMTHWRGLGKLSVTNSIEKYGYAIRLKSTTSVVYECYLPHSEFDDCCVYIDEITVDDILYRLSHHRDFKQFLGSLGTFYTNLKNEYEIDELLKAIWEYFDVIDFFELGEDKSILRAEVIDEVDESSENEKSNLPINSDIWTIENVRKLTWFDKMLRKKGLKDSPLFLWQLRITDEEYKELKDYLKHKLPVETDKENYDREVALYLAEFHRREYDYKDNVVGNSSPSTVVFNNLGFLETKTSNYKSLLFSFKSAMKSGAERLKLHLYKSPEDNRIQYLYSLFYNGGLPLKKVVSDDVSITWHRLIRKILESDERIEFNEDFAGLVKGTVANDSDSLKAFCQQLQEALLMEDYKLLPFCCNSELDPIYQFFLNQGKSVISEIKSKNPFQILWKFDVNRHRKVIRIRYNVSGPDSIPLKAEFFDGNEQIKEKDAFSIITEEDGAEIGNVTYNRTSHDFYSEEAFSIEAPYKNIANITVGCPEIDTIFVSEELDIYSPQIMKENEDGEYQLCSNRYIGHKNIIVIVPNGWTIENESSYDVEDGYSYLDTDAKIVILPSGVEGQQLKLYHGSGLQKVISATIPLTKVVVMNASMTENLRQNAYFNVKNLYYSLKKSDGTLRPLRREQLVFCNDRRTGKWTNEPSLGYVYVKPKGNEVYADPIKILNLGEDNNRFNIIYRDSSIDACTIIIRWEDGIVKCCDGNNISNNQWHFKKSELDDSRYVIFECCPSNGSKSFSIMVKTRFCDFQLFAPNGEIVKNNTYISLAQLQSYKYRIQGIRLKMTLKVGVSKFECWTEDVVRNSRVPLTVCDCGNRRKEERYILTESSLDNLLGGMSNIMKLLYSSQKDVRGATIYVMVSYNDKQFSYMIKKFPYRFEKIGFDKIVVRHKSILDEGIYEDIPYDGLIRALPLYNYANVLPVDIEPNGNGDLFLPETVCSWGNILLVSGKSECILPHAVNSNVDGELSKEERKEHFNQVYLPMRDKEYPNALMWSDTWRRCCYWYETALREHIPASSLFDLMVIMQDGKLLCRFVFNILLKGLKTGNFSEYKKNLKRNLIEFSKSNHFLWIWVNKNDYSLMSFMPFIGEDWHRYDEFLQGWYFTRMDTKNLMLLIENKTPTEEQLIDFITGFLATEYTDFMDDLRASSLAEFIAGNTLEKTVEDLLQSQDCQQVDLDEIRNATSNTHQYLSPEDEKVFERYAEKVINMEPNFVRFYGRSEMFLKQMQGDENTNVFSQKVVVRRSILYYTSTFIDSFIKLWLSKNNIK